MNCNWITFHLQTHYKKTGREVQYARITVWLEPYQLVCKTCLKRPLKKKSKIGYRLMQAESIAECSKGSILQYFRPSLSYHLSLRSLFCLVLSGRLRQVLLHIKHRHTPRLH